MTDVIYVLVIVAFFAIAVAYVKGCAHIVGDDEVVRVETDDPGSDGADRGAEEATAV